MKTKTVEFHSAKEIVDFVAYVQKFEFDVDIKYEHIVVDAKSILGAMAIGANRKVEICMHTGDREE